MSLEDLKWWLEFAFLAAFLLSVLATYLLSLLLRRWHRAQVGRLTAAYAKARPGQADAPPFEYADTKEPPKLSGRAGRLRARIRRRRLTLAAVYVVAGFAYAMTAAYVMIRVLASEEPPPPYAAAALCVLFCMPVAWTAGFVYGLRLRWRLAAVAALLGSSALLARDEADVVVYIATTLLLLPIFFFGLIAWRKLRAIAMTVLVPVSILLPGMVAAYAAVRLLPDPGASASRRAGLALGVLAAALVAALALTAARVWLYVRRRASDQTLLLNTYWMTLTVWLTTLAIVPEWPAGGWMAAAYGSYFLCASAGLWLRRRGPAPPNVRLLLLRVYGAAERSEGSERLLYDLGEHWRHAGSIQLIAGTDVAGATLDPDELIDLVAGRLSLHFVRGGDDLKRRVEALERGTGSDPDGRYRVTELFCFMDTWREAFGALLKNSDAVLMDLRGFGPANEGVAHELREVIGSGRARRLVIIVDGSTDAALLRRQMKSLREDAVRDGLAAEDGAHTPRVLYIARQNGREVEYLLRALCEAARPEVLEAESPRRAPQVREGSSVGRQAQTASGCASRVPEKHAGGEEG